MTERERALIILPTYNESENLEPMAEAIFAVGPFHILVVDDNSPDGTGALADRLATEYPDRVFVLHRAAKEGLGRAYPGRGSPGAWSTATTSCSRWTPIFRTTPATCRSS